MITAPPRAWTPSPTPAARASDEELVRRVREGDERAFDEVYARYRESLHRYCHSIVRQREDAEEAYQATMLAAYQTLSDREAPVVTLRPWLYKVAHNACVSVLRRRPADPPAPFTGLEVAPGRVDERSEIAAELRQLRRDLDELSDGQRAALVMRELGGLGHEEIGRAIGEDAAIVKQLIYNARLALQDLASGRDMACDRVRRTLSDGDRRVVRGRALRAHVRACAACRGWEEALRTRPARLAALAPVLSAMGLHELLGTAFGSATTGMGAFGATAGGGGIAAASGGGALVGAAAAAGAGAAGAGAGASLVAQVAIIGSTALIGGGAVMPAIVAPAGADRPVAVVPARWAPAADAAATTPAIPVGGELGVPVEGTSRADLGSSREAAPGAGRDDGAAPAADAPAGHDDLGEDGGPAAEAPWAATAGDDEVKGLVEEREAPRAEGQESDGALASRAPASPGGGEIEHQGDQGGRGEAGAPAAGATIEPERPETGGAVNAGVNGAGNANAHAGGNQGGEADQGADGFPAATPIRPAAPGAVNGVANGSPEAGKGPLKAADDPGEEEDPVAATTAERVPPGPADPLPRAAGGTSDGGASANGAANGSAATAADAGGSAGAGGGKRAAAPAPSRPASPAPQASVGGAATA